MSFALFPVEGSPCMLGMVIGIQGLAPDERILGRPERPPGFHAVQRDRG
jgi:hypothetical protein